jgi:hypothetical protein
MKKLVKFYKISKSPYFAINLCDMKNFKNLEIIKNNLVINDMMFTKMFLDVKIIMKFNNINYPVYLEIETDVSLLIHKNHLFRFFFIIYFNFKCLI